jgi:tetratricopeptide (TPR) repeat protein/predicted Ser/Thr protein kinase
MSRDRIAHYRLLEKLGEGGMGVVFRALDTRLDRTVALKFLPPERSGDTLWRERFLREARAAASITHPNIATLYSIEEEQGEIFIVMEFVPGRSLRELIGELDLEHLIDIGWQIAGGLAAAHRQGVVHRDIKPENIIVGQDGRAKILDFGIASRGDAGTSEESGGTVAYMSPEQVRGEPADHRTDIFSLGVLLYELLTGEIPWRGAHRAALLYEIANVDPKPPLSGERADPGISSIVMKCLEKMPDARFGSAAELMQALDRLRPSTAPAPAERAVTGKGWPELRLFVAIAPGDLDEEQDHLRRRIFPRLRAFCRERGILLTVVDLPHGSGGSQGSIVSACLDEIDRCGPYFIALFGERGGFVPDLAELHTTPELLRRHPWLEDAAIAGMSIMEIALEYALLGDGALRRPGISPPLLYARRHERADDDDPERLAIESLKSRLKERGFRIGELAEPYALGEQVYGDLLEIVKRDFPDRGAATPLEVERRRHEAFAASRRQGYIPNAGYLKRLNEFADARSNRESGDASSTGQHALLLFAPSGAGKSSLAAYWADQYHRRHPELLVIEHYVGIGGSDDQYTIMRRVMSEIGEWFDREEEVPTTPEEIERQFPNWLGFASSSGSLPADGDESDVRMILVIDRLPESARGLGWLPGSIPSTLRLVATTSDASTGAQLRERGWEELEIAPLSERERQAVVIRVLGEQHGSSDHRLVTRIASDQKCASPLFLRTLLEELRLIARPDRIERTLEEYLAVADLEELFQRVLERLEDDFSTRTVRELSTLLWASDDGLSENELSEITRFSPVKLSSLVAVLDYHLLARDGLLTFFHDYLRRAVEQRYLPDERRRKEAHVRLAEYFQELLGSHLGGAGVGGAIPILPVRIPRELARQLRYAGDPERLKDLLCSIPVLMSLSRGEAQYELLNHWRALADRFDIEEAYDESLRLFGEGREPGAGEAELLRMVSNLMERLGRWDGAMRLARRMRSSSERAGDRSLLARSDARLGWLLLLRGSYPEAIEHLEHALELGERLPDPEVIAAAVGNLGIIYWRQGEYRRALECYHRQLDVAETMNDRRAISRAVGNIGIVHMNQGELQRAMEFMQRQLLLAEDLGDRELISNAVGNIAIIHFYRQEFDRALKYYRQQLAIDEYLGDRRGIAIATGNMGSAYEALGELEQALDCYSRHRAIAEEIGDRQGIFTAIGNSANIHLRKGDPQRALEEFTEALEGHRRIGYLHGVAHWLRGEAESLLALLERYDPEEMPDVPASHPGEAPTENWKSRVLQRARESLLECIALCEQLNQQDTLDSARELLATLDAA